MRLLVSQELLNVSDIVDGDEDTKLVSPCPSSQCSLQDEQDDEFEEEENAPELNYHTEDESDSEPSASARMMCFSDEMCTFTPDLLLLKSPVKRVNPRTSSTRRAPLRRHHNHEIPEDQQHQTLHESEPIVATTTPRASRSSLKLLRESATFEPNFQARMRQFVAQNRQKKEQIRLSVCEREDECIKASPTINRVRLRTQELHIMIG